MKELILALLSATAISVAPAADSSNAVQGEKEDSMTEAAIRQRVGDWERAVRARDLEAVLSLYATNIVSFDLDPPLRYSGGDNKRRAWQQFFTGRTGAIGYDVRELNVT